MRLPALELGPDDADACLVLLHGFGASAFDLAPLAEDLALPRTRVVLPNAPVISATIAGGLPLQAWYDIRTLEPSPDREDPAGVRASAADLGQLLAEQAARGIPPERTFLGGFSQGGAMALYVGLRHAERLGALVGLSTYLVLDEHLDAEAHPANRRTPVWMAHGTHDDVVPLHRGERAARRLQADGRHVHWETWPVDHSLHPAEIESLRDFLLECLEG